MEDGVSLDRDTVWSLLNPLSASVFQTEEQQHPWQTQFQIFDRPLLRLWDHKSGSQPDEDGCMRARAKCGRLDTFKSRKESLTVHINHSVWTRTPYISFTTSPSKLEDLANLRVQRHRGPSTLTVVDPNNRIRNGLPVLHVSDEMDYYNVADPYTKTHKYYEDHYICLWEVTDNQIVGHWQWEDLVENENWYEEIVIPAFRRNRNVVEAEHLSDLFTKLSLKTDPSDPTNFFGGRSDSSSELVCFFDDEVDDFDEAYDCFQDGSDTDDEVEESNATDDMIKIMEGDW